MFRCPECGFMDPAIWKASKWRRYSVYCYTTELEEFRPDLVEKLKKDSWINEKEYHYKITKDGRIVYRMLDIGRDEFKTHGFTERPKEVDPFQRKLTENV